MQDDPHFKNILLPNYDFMVMNIFYSYYYIDLNQLNKPDAKQRATASINYKKKISESQFMNLM
jgi:hypothetical protein